MINTPAWYITTREFADLVVETMSELGYFRPDDPSHPEDIVLSFQTVSEALAKGMGVAGRRMWDAEQGKHKYGMMQPKDLRKVVLPDDPEYPV